MSQGRSRGKASKGVVEFRPRVTRVIPVGARLYVLIIPVLKYWKLLTFTNTTQDYQGCPLGQLVTFVMLL